MRRGNSAYGIRQLALAAAAAATMQSAAIAGEGADVHYTGSLRLDRQGYVRSMYNLSAAAGGQSAADASRGFLSAHARSLGIHDPASSLKEERTDRVPGGSHVRFVQMHRGMPVYGARVVVSSDDQGAIRMVVSSTVPDLEVASRPSFDGARAIAIAREALHTGTAWIGSPDAAELMAYRAPGGGDHLIYRVTLTREDPPGDWELLVDAESGSVLRTGSLFVEYGGGRPAAGQGGRYVQGQGHVFLADPLSISRQFYGSAGFTDNNDQDSGPLTACRTAVTLDSLTYADGMFWLRGPYCSIVDIESPVDSLPAALTPDGFSFTRGEHGFEAVNAYYHVTAAYKRLLELGFSSPTLEQIRIDPHGFQGKDNSHFSPTGNWISFGTGGVDDAEDADVIWHEYGHAIQYAFAAGWGDGECAALGEGYADYWAASYSRWAGRWTPADAPYNWIYKWDGHNEFWSGRVLNDQRTYPFGSLSAHSAGQIWSSALMSIWNDLGRDVTDMLVTKSLFYLGTGATGVDAAHAMLQADRDLYQGEHLPTLIYWLGTVKRFFDPASLPNISTDAGAPENGAPGAFALDQNYPNPFNPSTQIRFTLGAASTVRLRIYNVIGQEIAVLADGPYPAGSHTVVWNASGLTGTAVGSGVYIARLTAEPSAGGERLSFSRKMALVR